MQNFEQTKQNGYKKNEKKRVVTLGIIQQGGGALIQLFQRFQFNPKFIFCFFFSISYIYALSEIHVLQFFSTFYCLSFFILLLCVFLFAFFFSSTTISLAHSHLAGLKAYSDAQSSGFLFSPHFVFSFVIFFFFLFFYQHLLHICMYCSYIDV